MLFGFEAEFRSLTLCVSGMD